MNANASPVSSLNELATVQGRTYVLTKMPAIQAMKMQARIIKVVAPALTDLPALARLAVSPKPEEGLDMLVSILPKLDMDAATDIIVELCSTCRVGTQGTQSVGEFIDFDTEFVDDLMPAYELAIEVGRFNFGKYFAALTKKMQTGDAVDS